VTRRRAVVLLASAVVLAAAALLVRRLVQFPPDTVPEGAYLRIAAALGRGEPAACFAYLEDRAQHAAYSIRDFRRQSVERIEATYPEPERARLVEAYRVHGAAADGADVWVDLAAKRGWVSLLRRDLSGIAKVEISGERASVETVRGTRYAFRRRENGIWGLTTFTAELVTESERAARDWDVVQRAAEDYERGR
jgi:hypothetical protein